MQSTYFFSLKTKICFQKYKNCVLRNIELLLRNENKIGNIFKLI